MRRTVPSDLHGGPSVSEAQLKVRVIELAHAAGWRVYHRPARYQRNGGGSGYPDLTLARHGQVRWFELKADGGKLSQAQLDWHEALPEAHVLYPRDLDNGLLVRLLV